MSMFLDAGHFAICIPFRVSGRSFYATGFLMPGEDPLPGRLVFERLRAGGFKIAGPDTRKLLWEHRDELPNYLHEHWLVICCEHDPIYFIFMWGIGWDNEEKKWRGNAFGLSTPWRRDVLVIIESH